MVQVWPCFIFCRHYLLARCVLFLVVLKKRLLKWCYLYSSIVQLALTWTHFHIDLSESVAVFETVKLSEWECRYHWEIRSDCTAVVQNQGGYSLSMLFPQYVCQVKSCCLVHSLWYLHRMFCWSWASYVRMQMFSPIWSQHLLVQLSKIAQEGLRKWKKRSCNLNCICIIFFLQFPVTKKSS